MKKYLLLFALACQMLTANATTKISRVEPTDWYVGMKDPTLQLM
ncbi:MAG: cyclomaltodextrinase N-terminal domain-containing protein, partial [Prevotella sp.]|nr:cyclomaltodextrinase N-terminal domain-containing protein [Prevotella sp.]